MHNILHLAILWLVYIQRVIAQNEVSTQFFTDAYCNNASPLNPSLNIPLNVCVITPGAMGIQGAKLVCGDGTVARFNSYYGGSCSGEYVAGDANYCIQHYPDNVPAFIAYCGARGQPQIASTTTVMVAGNSVLATSAATSAGQSPTSTKGQTTQVTTSSSPSSTPSSSAHGWSGLSNGERIGAIIALAVGIPSVIFGGIAAYCACVRK